MELCSYRDGIGTRYVGDYLWKGKIIHVVMNLLLQGQAVATDTNACSLAHSLALLSSSLLFVLLRPQPHTHPFPQ
jgi:hypothetical protein